MKITICGSMIHEPQMVAAAKELRDLGYEVEKPNVVEGHVYEDNLDANARLKQGFINEHFQKIDQSDAVLVVNEQKNGIANYIGGNTLIEIAHAYSQGLEVFILNPLPDVSYRDEIAGMQPIILDGTVARLDEYVQSLPLLYVSSKSLVKHTAISRGLRKAGLRTRILGVEVESGVNEQPMSIIESYDGALNRHLALASVVGDTSYDYLATIESGLHEPHPDHNVFGCDVVVLQKNGDEPKVGISLDLEFPREMTDKIPSQYPDVGVLVQQEYGSTLKDPYPYFTNGNVTRVKILENSVYNVAVQLSV